MSISKFDKSISQELSREKRREKRRSRDFNRAKQFKSTRIRTSDWFLLENPPKKRGLKTIGEVLAEQIYAVLTDGVISNIDLRNAGYEIARRDARNEDYNPLYCPAKYKESLKAGRISIGNKQTQEIYNWLMNRLHFLGILTGKEDLMQHEAELSYSWGSHYNINYGNIPLRFFSNKKN